MVRYIGKVQIRKWLLPELKLIAKTHGFKVRSGVNVDVEQDAGSVLNTMFWQLASDDSLAFSSGKLRVKKVEEILLQITGLEVYKNKDTIKVHAPEFDKTTRIITCQQDVVELAGTFRQVFEEVYLPGFERFSQPERILEFWDSLDWEGRSKYFQDGYKYIKILILSKMVGEKKYEERCVEYLNYSKELLDTGKPHFQAGYGYCQKAIEFLNTHELSW